MCIVYCASILNVQMLIMKENSMSLCLSFFYLWKTAHPHTAVLHMNHFWLARRKKKDTFSVVQMGNVLTLFPQWHVWQMINPDFQVTFKICTCSLSCHHWPGCYKKWHLATTRSLDKMFPLSWTTDSLKDIAVSFVSFLALIEAIYPMNEICHFLDIPVTQVSVVVYLCSGANWSPT